MTIDVAFIGTGNIASLHLARVAASGDARVAAVCDIDEERANQAAAANDAAVFTDHETMFAEATFDAVFVCLPPFAHTDQELLAAEHDVALFVEKPLGLDREYAHEVRAAVEEAGIVTQVGHMYRYADIVERAVELLGDRQVALLDGQWLGGVPGTAWWREEARSGGQVIEQAVHVYDLLRLFGGDVERASAVGGQTVVTDAIDFPDATSATLDHETGAVGQVSATSASPAGDVGLTVVAEDAHLEFDLQGGVLTGHVDGEEIHHENSVAVEWGDYGGGADSFRKELDDFLAAIEADDPGRPRSPYADAVGSFELTLAVTDALDSDGPVEVR